MRKNQFLMKNLSAPCDKAGFFPLVLPLWGRLQRGKAGCGRPFSSLLLPQTEISVSNWTERKVSGESVWASKSFFHSGLEFSNAVRAP